MMVVLCSIIRTENTAKSAYLEGKMMGDLLYDAAPKGFDPSKLFECICVFTTYAKDAIKNMGWGLGFGYHWITSDFLAGVVDMIQEKIKIAEREKREQKEEQMEETRNLPFPLLSERQVTIYFENLEIIVSPCFIPRSFIIFIFLRHYRISSKSNARPFKLIIPTCRWTTTKRNTSNTTI